MNRFLSFLGGMLLIQGLIAFASFPVLVAWGLPVSLLGVVGNCIFLPFILAFLLGSSLLVLLLPFGPLALFCGRFLDYLTFAWQYLLSFGGQSSGGAFVFYGYIPLALVFCSFLLFLHLRLAVRRKTWLLVVFLCIVLALFSFGRKFFVDSKVLCNCGGAFLELYANRGGVCVVDRGQRRSVRGLDTWARYRLPQFLGQTFGVTVIDQYEVAHLTPAVCRVVEQLCQEGLVKMVVVHAAEKQDFGLIARLQKCTAQSGVLLC